MILRVPFDDLTRSAPPHCSVAYSVCKAIVSDWAAKVHLGQKQFYGKLKYCDLLVNPIPSALSLGTLERESRPVRIIRRLRNVDQPSGPDSLGSLQRRPRPSIRLRRLGEFRPARIGGDCPVHSLVGAPGAPSKLHAHGSSGQRQP